MISNRSLVSLALAALAATPLVGAQPAEADQPRIVVVTPSIDLQAQRNNQRALQFQQQQRLYREQDRRDIMRPSPPPNVPKIRPTCTPTNGVRCN
jgi:hypothetical protein